MENNVVAKMVFPSRDARNLNLDEFNKFLENGINFDTSMDEDDLIKFFDTKYFLGIFQYLFTKPGGHGWSPKFKQYYMDKDVDKSDFSRARWLDLSDMVKLRRIDTVIDDGLVKTSGVLINVAIRNNRYCLDIQTKRDIYVRYGDDKDYSGIPEMRLGVLDLNLSLEFNNMGALKSLLNRAEHNWVHADFHRLGRNQNA